MYTFGLNLFFSFVFSLYGQCVVEEHSWKGESVEKSDCDSLQMYCDNSDRSLTVQTNMLPSARTHTHKNIRGWIQALTALPMQVLKSFQPAAVRSC